MESISSVAAGLGLVRFKHLISGVQRCKKSSQSSALVLPVHLTQGICYLATHCDILSPLTSRRVEIGVLPNWAH